MTVLRLQQCSATEGWRSPQLVLRVVAACAACGRRRLPSVRCGAPRCARRRPRARLAGAAAVAGPSGHRAGPKDAAAVLHVMAGSQGAPRGLQANCWPPASGWRRVEPARPPVGAQPPPSPRCRRSPMMPALLTQASLQTSV